MMKSVSKKEVVKKLDTMLIQLGVRKKITPDDILSVIYHSTDSNEMQEIMNALQRYAKSNQNFKLLIEAVQLAWNYSPHKMLGNLSPNEKMLQHYKGIMIKPKPRPEYKSDKTVAYQLAQDDFPDDFSVKNYGDRKWGIELPLSYYQAKQELLELKVWELPENEAQRRLEKLLKKEPFYPLAVLSLKRAYLDQGKEKEAKKLLEIVKQKFESLLPEKFELDRDCFPWAIWNNRDFLTLLLDYAFFIQAYEGVKAAIPSFEYVLKLSPNDNQGVRRILATAYLKTNQLNKMLELAGKFNQDITQEILMGKALCLYKLKKEPEAKKWIIKNFEAIKHSVEELLKKTHEEPEIDFSRVEIGGKDEAYLYWLDQGGLWSAASGAMAWLREIDAIELNYLFRKTKLKKTGFNRCRS